MVNTFFLGGSSQYGFMSRFADIIHTKGYYTYILKGGPGTGKSTLMKKIAKEFDACNIDLYYCSSDIKSIDAVVVHDHHSILVDGTAPHVFNADFPGIAQTLIDLGAHWDKTRLAENEDKIRDCFARNAAYHGRARSFISALSNICGGIYDIAMENINPDNISLTAETITGGLKAKSSKGKTVYKQLSAITSEGYLTRELPEGCHSTIFSDSNLAAGFELMKKIRDIVTNKGYDIIASECVLLPQKQVEHILIPTENLAFSLATPLNKMPADSAISCKALYSTENNTEETKTALKIAENLENEAAYSINKALEIHDELESYYIGALDFKSLDNVTKKIIAEIKGN